METNLIQLVHTWTLISRDRENFGDWGGGRRLAEALGVDDAMASCLKSGTASSYMRLSAYYGYVPHHTRNYWKPAKIQVDPKSFGRRFWTSKVIADARGIARMPKHKLPAIKDVAARHGISVGAY